MLDIEEASSMRTFISLKFSEEVINYIRQLQEQIKKENLFEGKFTGLENLHLTLKFLGEINEEKLEHVRERLGEIEFSQFDTRLESVGFFDNQRSGIVWLSLTNCEELQKKIDEVLVGPFEKEMRFMSHLTIARVKKIEDKKRLINYLKDLEIEKMKTNIDKFYLQESKLSSRGPEYSVVEEYKLI